MSKEHIPKDGDPIIKHSGHEIVTAQANGEAYKYCRTCKVEVTEMKVGVDLANKPDFTASQTREIPQLHMGAALDKLAGAYNLQRIKYSSGLSETDDEFTIRIMKKLRS